MNLKTKIVYKVSVEKADGGVVYEHGGDIDAKKLLVVEHGLQQTIEGIIKILSDKSEGDDPGTKEESSTMISIEYHSDILGNTEIKVPEMTLELADCENLILALNQVMKEVHLTRMEANNMVPAPVMRKKAIDFTPASELV